MVINMFENLSVREKVCQMMMVKADPKLHKKQFGSIKNFLEEYPVGGIFAGSEVIRDTNHNKDELKEVIQEYQEASKIPLFCAADGESGFGSAAEGCTRFGGSMALGTTGSEKLAYDSAKVTAIEGRAVGFNWDFSPACDLNINRHNLIMNTRSLSDDPELACRLIKQLVKGYQENGIIATGKHFPGDGVDYRNQHLVISSNTLSMDEWYKKSGAVFKAAIEAGVYSMMIGHISLPAYQTDSVKGHYPPATLSKDLVMKLLKHDLKFDGVAITDALDMGGFNRWYYERDEAEVKAFEAGVDMLLWPHLITADTITKRLESGEIPMSRLDDAISRIALLRNRIFSFQPKENTDVSGLAERTVKQIAENCSYIVSNELGLIPLDAKKYKKIRIVGMAPDPNECMSLSHELADEFKKHGAETEVIRNWDNYLKDHRTETDRNYDLIVYAMFYGMEHPTMMFREDELSAHSALSFDRDKTVIISFRSPYLYREYFETAETFVNSQVIGMKECVEALYGEKEFKGKASVKY